MTKMMSGGIQSVRAVLPAMALHSCQRGAPRRIAEFIPLTPQAIRKAGTQALALVEHHYSSC
jgi:hypothetical protein